MAHQYPYSIKRHGTTLEKCDDEPVQTPGCIQSYGLLVVLRPGDLTILQVSENSATWLGLEPGELLGKNVADAVGESVARLIVEALKHEKVERAPLYVTTLKAGQQKNALSLHITLHTYMGMALLELEDAGDSDPEPSDHLRVDPDYYGLVRKTLARFQEATTIEALSQSISEEVRQITELDRVMVYRFHTDESGEVIAESKGEDAKPWLGFRYPAHDIPRPAREIFQKIWSRPVPDVRAELFEMVPLVNPDTNRPTDMTFCSLRGASTMYTEYLDNMGIRAALTMPLRQGNQLWGLIACHHNTPKVMSYRIRAAAEFLARSASQQLLWAEAAENTEYRISLEAANYALMSKVALEPELSAFTEGPVNLRSKLDCSGAALFFQETWNRAGQTPGIPQMTALKNWLLTLPALQPSSPNPVFQTDSLPSLFPPALEFGAIGSGLMCFCFSLNPVGLILYFREETIQELTWAGDPHELPIVAGPSGPRLSPRKSFELWRETVRNRSMPWKPVEIDSIRKLRGMIIDRLVSSAQQLNDLRLLVIERTREVVASNERAEALAAIVESSEDAIIGQNLGSVITSWNPAAEKIFGFSASEMLGSATRLIVPDDRQNEHTHVLEMIKRGEALNNLETLRITKCRQLINVSITTSPIRDSSGHVVGASKVVRDITNQKTAEKKLRASEELFRQAFLNSAIGFALVGLNGDWQKVNPKLIEIFGYREEEMLGTTFRELIHPDDESQDLARKLVSGEIDNYEIEKRYIHKSGRVVWAHSNVSLARHIDGTPAHFIAQIQDVTERHQSQETIRAALEEKEVLLREVHHRVKNNMQVISSLLNLQRGYLHDELDVKIFEDCQYRIRSMALVHERLYSSTSLASIDFAEYLKDLTKLIFQGQSKTQVVVNLQMECESVEMEIDTAIPLGLVANEVISNAFKHAFTGRANGTITLALKHEADGFIRFSVLDNGVGFPEELKARKKKSLGMRLIESLSRQLRATLTFENQPLGGSRVDLVLPQKSIN